MITVNVETREGCKIDLGIRGENEARQIVFDLSYFITNYGNGVAVLLVKRSEDVDPYPATNTTQSESSLSWVLTDVDTAIDGRGKAELFWYVDNVLAKSVVYATWVQNDIGVTTTEPPASFEDWVEELTSLGAETLANAQAAQLAQQGAETAQGLAETAQGKAEDAQAAAETAQGLAETAQTNAEIQGLKSEGYAVGTQDGQAVASGSPYYHNNSKYYSDLAAQSAEEAGYVSFEIDSDGHLIFTKTTTTDLDFSINSNGHLILEVG